VDCEIKLDVFEKKTLREIARMQPFGKGNPSPRFLTKAKIVVANNKIHILQKEKLWSAYIKKSSTKNMKQDKMYYILFSPQLNFPFFNIEEIFEEN
jgi:single-stranded DNA-specific DHH superfamily exonuclease